jgi:hypothetical protein
VYERGTHQLVFCAAIVFEAMVENMPQALVYRLTSPDA